MAVRKIDLYEMSASVNAQTLSSPAREPGFASQIDKLVQMKAFRRIIRTMFAVFQMQRLFV